MINNSYQAQALIERLVIEGREPESVYVLVRNEKEYPGLREVLGNKSVKDFKAAVDDFASSVKAKLTDADQRGPLVRRHVELQHKAGALVGDVMAAMARLTLDNPRDIRDCIEQMMRLERLQSAVQAEMDLKKCLETLQAKEVDVSEFQARFDELFPAMPEDDDAE